MNKYLIDCDSPETAVRLAEKYKADSVQRTYGSLTVWLTPKQAEAIWKEPGVLHVVLASERLMDPQVVHDVNFSVDNNWALAAICNNPSTFRSPLTGNKTDIVIFDTGILYNHDEFSPSNTFVPYKPKTIDTLLDEGDFYWNYATFSDLSSYDFSSADYGEFKTSSGYLKTSKRILTKTPTRIPVLNVSIEERDTTYHITITPDPSSPFFEFASRFSKYMFFLVSNFPVVISGSNSYLGRGLFGIFPRYSSIQLQNGFDFSKTLCSITETWNPEIHSAYLVPVSAVEAETTEFINEETETLRGFSLVLWMGYRPRKIVWAFDNRYSLHNGGDYVHGTAVAACAGGSTCGVAKDTQIINSLTDFSNSSLASCVDLILSYHKRKLEDKIKRPTIVSCSFGPTAIPLPQELYSWYDFIYTMFSELADNGVVIIAAAGNGRSRISSRRYQSCPATFPFVITAGSTNIDNNLSYFTCYGSGLDLFAPGERVKAAMLPTNIAHPDNPLFSDPPVPVSAPEYYDNIQEKAKSLYCSVKGTSFSCPFTAGVVAVALEALGNPIFSTMDEVLEFKSFFLENYTREFSPKYFTLYKTSFTQEQYDDPNNWADGFPPDDIDPELPGDTGSPNRLLYLSQKVFVNNRKRIDFDAVDACEIILDSTGKLVFNGASFDYCLDSQPTAVIKNGGFVRHNNKLYRIHL